MKLVSNKFETPSGQWNYTEPSTGVKFRTYAFDQLVDMVRKHKKGNNIEMPPDWYEQFENELCNQNENIPCYDPEKSQTGCVLSLSIIKRFLTTVWHWVRDGGKLVDRSLADRRSEICATCPNNKFVGGCFGCKGVTSIINELKGDSTSKFEDKLQSCSVCCCVLSVKVFIPREVMEDPSIEYPSWCWMNKEIDSTQNKPLQEA